MIIHMNKVRTTLVLEKQRLTELKRLSISQQRTLTSVVDEFLREGLARHRRQVSKPKAISLPSYDMGQPRVNLADRERLFDLMEG